MNAPTTDVERTLLHLLDEAQAQWRVTIRQAEGLRGEVKELARQLAISRAENIRLRDRLQEADFRVGDLEDALDETLGVIHETVEASQRAAIVTRAEDVLTRKSEQEDAEREEPTQFGELPGARGYRVVP